jgi:hypothetical protein
MVVENNPNLNTPKSQQYDLLVTNKFLHLDQTPAGSNIGSNKHPQQSHDPTGVEY